MTPEASSAGAPANAGPLASAKPNQPTIVPTLGRIVYYTVPQYVAEEINRRRQHARDSMDYHRWKKNGSMVHVGNEVKADQIVAAMVVAVWGNTPTCAVNLKLFLDGADDYWVTSTSVEDAKSDGSHTAGKYHWMAYQVGQAAKTEALQSQLAEAKAS